MAYAYGKNEQNPPTIESMYGEYRVARLHLTVQDFINIYPEVTQAQLMALARKYEEWVDEVMQSFSPNDFSE